MKRLQSAIFALMLPFPLAFYAQAQTPQPPPPPKSFSSSTGTNHLEGLDVDFLASELETLKTKEFVADALEIAKRNPDLANILLQSLVFTHLMELTRWTKAAALSAYAKTAPDPQVAEAISYCYVQNMKSLDALKTCIDTLNQNRAAFVQTQLGFQSVPLFDKVIGTDPDRKLARAYAPDYQLSSEGQYRLDVSNQKSLRQRFDSLQKGVETKLGTGGTCNLGTIPASISLMKTDQVGADKPFLIEQTLSVDADVYLDAMEESDLCDELAKALALMALQGEVEEVLSKLLSAQGTAALHETELSSLVYDTKDLERKWADWNSYSWVRYAQYSALRERVARRLEDRYRRAGEMLGR